MTAANTTAGREIRFLREHFDALVEPLGHRSIRQKAKFLDYPRSCFARTYNGAQEPTAEFIACIRRAIPMIHPDHFFDWGSSRDQAA